MDSLRSDLKQLICTTLQLTDVTPAEIADDTILFGEGLGLDSVDALELAMEIEKRFGLRLGADEASREAMRDVASLAAYLTKHTSKVGAPP